MESLKKRWYSVPSSIRKPIVLIVGLLIVIASPFTGVLPGPGGIPVFLIGIAILATEFEWAKRLRDWVLKWVKMLGAWWRQHKVLGTAVIVVAAVMIAAAAFYGYRLLTPHLPF
jgi:uncharacterized protein (TIGR02611 family)